jgi:hypothetical protein
MAKIELTLPQHLGRSYMLTIIEYTAHLTKVREANVIHNTEFLIRETSPSDHYLLIDGFAAKTPNSPRST